MALAALMAGVRVSGTPLKDHRVVVYGAGTAGVGIADLLREAMVSEGAEGSGYEAFYLITRKGLLTDDMDELEDFQRPYARTTQETDGWSTDSQIISLADVVSHTQPTILIGTSTHGGGFTEAIVKDMAAHCERPIIFPMSNPTVRAEAVPADLREWTDGRALIATGSPFGPVQHGPPTASRRRTMR